MNSISCVVNLGRYVLSVRVNRQMSFLFFHLYTFWCFLEYAPCAAIFYTVLFCARVCLNIKLHFRRLAVLPICICI